MNVLAVVEAIRQEVRKTASKELIFEDRLIDLARELGVDEHTLVEAIDSERQLVIYEP